MNKKKLMMPRRLLALLLVLCSLLTLAACGGDEPAKETANNDKPSGNAGQTVVTVKNSLGTPLQGMQVYVYADDTQQDMTAFTTTDAEGKATCLTQGDKSVVVLSGTAPGYKVEKNYPVTGKQTDIVLEPLATTETGSLPTDKAMMLGDPMVDFTVTDIDGTTYTASEVLKEKKALVLNFWYTTCGPCAAEFPYLQKAYDAYKDRVTLLAMDSYPADDVAAIKAFRTQHELNFPWWMWRAAGRAPWASSAIPPPLSSTAMVTLPSITPAPSPRRAFLKSCLPSTAQTSTPS